MPEDIWMTFLQNKNLQKILRSKKSCANIMALNALKETLAREFDRKLASPTESA